MKHLKVEEGLRIFDINWETDTAGPSPNNNKRIEVFLLGCDKAQQGNPCKGCFNSITWDKSKAEWSLDPIELADMINEYCDPNNKYIIQPNNPITSPQYITIGGGEPSDQIEKLIPFTKKLKEYGFHIMMYSWRSLLNNIDKFEEIMKYIDIIVDGEFILEEKLYNQYLGDGMLSSIGSGNQIIWDIKAYNEQPKLPRNAKYLYGKHMRELAGLYIKPNTNDLVYITKN